MRCVAVIRAVRAALREESYAGRFTFEVFAWEHEKSVAARKTFGFGADNHGLALLTADGRLLSVRPGHDYGAPEIRSDLDKALQGPP
jgi:hypothetical protein